MHPIIVLGLLREATREWWRGIPYPGSRRRHERAMERSPARELNEQHRRRDAERLARRQRGEREW